VARGLEQAAQQVHGRRLAVRAGDADDPQVGGGIARERRRGWRHRGADVVHHHLRDVAGILEAVVDHERRGPPGDRRAGEVVAVAREPGHAEEDRPGLHPAIVEGERADRDGRLLGPEQVAQRHRAQGYFGGMRRYGSANWAIFPKAGAATSPP
jgi:hypothetical protein